MFCNTNHDVHDHMFAHSFYEGPTGSGQGYSLPHSQGFFVDTKYEGGVVHLVRGSMILWGGGFVRIHEGARSIPDLYQSGTRLVPDWQHTGTRLASDWDQIGTRLVPGWYQTDWYQIGTVPDRHQIGTRLVPGWYRTGTRVITLQYVCDAMVGARLLGGGTSSHNSTVCV
jgi:hypothetical protein